MSDSSSEGGDADVTAEGATAEPRQDAAEPDDSRSVRSYLDYAVVGGLALLGFVAVVQFYMATSSIIGVWVTPEYQPFFRALFNLAVLLAVGAALSWQVRRMRGGD